MDEAGRLLWSPALAKAGHFQQALRALFRWGLSISEGGEPTAFSSVWLPWQSRNKFKLLVPKQNSLHFISCLFPVCLSQDDNISLQLFSLLGMEAVGEAPVGAGVVFPLSPPAEASPVPGCCWQHSAQKDFKKKTHNEPCPAEQLCGIIALIDTGLYKGFCR